MININFIETPAETAAETAAETLTPNITVTMHAELNVMYC